MLTVPISAASDERSAGESDDEAIRRPYPLDR